MSSLGYRSCALVVSLDDEEAARLVLERYETVTDVERHGDRLVWRLDRSLIPSGELLTAEQQIIDALTKAISLHRTGP